MLAKKVQGAGGAGAPVTGLSTVFVSNVGTGLLSSVDVQNTSSMTVLDTLTSLQSATPYRMSADPVGEVLYYPNETNATIVSYDISDPSNISQLDTVASMDGTRAAALDSVREVVFTIDDTGISGLFTFVAIDVSNPSSMSIISSFTPGNDFNDIICDETNQLAFGAVSGGGGIRVIDVSNTSSMSSLVFVSTPATNPSKMACDPSNTYLYATRGNFVWVFDYSTPASTSLVHTYTLSGASFWGIDIDIANSVLYVADGANDSIRSLDISNPLSISLIDTVTNATTLDLVRDIKLDINREILFAAVQTSDSVVAIDVSDPANMSEISNVTDATNLDALFAISGI